MPISDKEIESLLYNFENYRKHHDQYCQDVAEASVGCGMAKIPNGLPSSSVETAVLKRLDYDVSPLYQAIVQTLKIDKFNAYYQERYLNNKSWKETEYSRRTYFRRRKNMLKNIKKHLK